MADLRITGVTNNQLELQAPDGTRHYLAINDDLVKALRNREVSLPPSLTPREIQQQIRLGATVTEVVEGTGADEELVLKFAKPIISELNHIVSLARNIRLSLAGDRFAEPTPVQFGQVMDERLESNGATQTVWSAKKSTDGDWLVSISFATKDGSGVATWGFDPKQLFLTPENEAALQLSNGVPLSAISKTVSINPEPIEEVEAAPSHPALTVVPEVQSEDEPEELLFDEPQNTVTTPLRIVPDDEVVTPEFESEPEIVQDQSEETPEADDQSDYPAEDSEESMNENPKPTSNSRWAEVLFGTKDEDEGEEN